ncbi:MAG: hypothetical protein ACRDXX_02275, partial [Stackebrandtia sp.]
ACTAAAALAGAATLTPASAEQTPSADITLPIPWPWPTSSTSEPGGDGPSPGETEDPEEPPDRDDDPTTRPPECAPENLPSGEQELAEAYAECLDTGYVPDDDARAADLPPAGATPPTLSASTMTMSGLSYGGVVEVPTAAGGMRALEFTMDTMELEGMDNAADFGDGDAAQLHVINAESTAVLDGDVRQYVRRISGKIFGIVPVEFTPDFPPPLTPPYLVLTDVVAETVYVRCDVVRLPHLLETAG